MLTRIKIGHFTNLKDATGCTVILPPAGNICAASAFGAAPGTRELILLHPGKKIQEIHALVLTGGSAFGLNCAHGVMEQLAQDGIGFETEYGKVPIVPAAVIFDKNIGRSSAYPTYADAQIAYENAQFMNNQQGNVGAGTGATVGKWAGLNFAMKAGLGLTQLKFNKAQLVAITVTNAVGDVLNSEGQILAGAIDKTGNFLAHSGAHQRWQSPRVGMAQNTVLTAVFTNFRFGKTEIYYLAQRAHFAITRRIEPSHTSFDGDVSFVCCLPEVEISIDLAASLIISAVQQSIENSVKYCTSLHGFKSYQEITGKK